MLIDDYTEFADDYDAGAAAVSNEIVNMGDVIDTGSIVRDLGQGTPLYVVFTISEAFADTSSGAGLVFRIVSDATSTPSVVVEEATLHYASDAFADTELTLGKAWSVALPTDASAYERYLGVQLQNDAADALSAGKVNAFLSLNPVGTITTYADAAN